MSKVRRSRNRDSPVKRARCETAMAFAATLEATCSAPEGYDPDVEDAASEDDREWFELRCLRRWRIRLRHPGEFGTGSLDCREVLVQQVFVGHRIRRPL